MHIGKYTCEGFSMTLRMFGTGHFCTYQVLNVIHTSHISTGCVDNNRQILLISLIRLLRHMSTSVDMSAKWFCQLQQAHEVCDEMSQWINWKRNLHASHYVSI